MSRATAIAAVVLAAGGLLLLTANASPLGGRTLPEPSRVAYLGVECTTRAASLSVTLGGVTVGSTTYGPEDGDLSGGSCVVIPPAGLPASVMVRCAVTAPNTATVYAATPLSLGVSVAGPTTWCTRVETLNPEE